VLCDGLEDWVNDGKGGGGGASECMELEREESDEG